jgi:hypothetical protein
MQMTDVMKGPVQFTATPDPDRVQIGESAGLVPQNPFYTWSYVEARRAMGDRPWVLALRRGTQTVACCPAFLRVGRLSRSLEIPSWPDCDADDAGRFWQALLGFCRQRGVTRLELNSFASATVSIPIWPGEQFRRKRCEYVLDLGIPKTDLWKRLSSNHARNIKRARKLGLTVMRTREPDACRIHTRLMAASLERRKDRGESVFENDALQPVLALTKHGAGELFQIVGQEQVLSSILVLIAAKGAYYHSAGTSPEGMTCGASHFLIQDITQTLQGDGLERFNLGGADDTNAGLERFKTGFGAIATELEAAEFSFAGPLRRAASRIATFINGMRSGR